MRNANIISHSSGVIVVIIIVVGFMGHWSQLLAVVHGVTGCMHSSSQHALKHGQACSRSH